MKEEVKTPLTKGLVLFGVFLVLLDAASNPLLFPLRDLVFAIACLVLIGSATFLWLAFHHN